MSLEAADDEIRERFSEASLILNHLRATAPDAFQSVDDTQRALRGLCLVLIYAAVERSSNAIVEATLIELSTHNTPAIAYMPSIQGLLHFAALKALRDCGAATIFQKSAELFSAAFQNQAASFAENPLADKMQNVDGGTLEWVASLFGVANYQCTAANRGRLGNLRERRNAVAHGRESAANVGGRFSIVELGNMYNAADEEITRFLLALRRQCDERLYMRNAA